MTSNSRHVALSTQAQTELELLQCLLQGDGACGWVADEDASQEAATSYPWNPSELPTDDYFATLEQELAQAGWTEDELNGDGQRLAATLEQAWATITPVAAVRDAIANQVGNDLFQQFLGQVPHPLLEAIVQRAQSVIAAQITLADQLVACVQGVLPGWNDDDLQVLARPFAYAMRGAETEMLEAALRSVRCAAWTELSGIEQARLSLAIARYALAQTPAHSHHHA